MSRPASNIIQVVSPTDQVLIDIARELFEQEIIDSVRLSLAPYASEQFNDLESLEEAVESLGDLTFRKFRNVHYVTSVNFRCTFERGITHNGQIIPDVHRAEFMIHGQNSSDEVALAFSDTIHEHCNRDVPKLSLGSSTVHDALATHVESLATVATKVSANLAEAHADYDKRLLQHQEKLSQQSEEVEKARAEQHKKQLEELAQVQAELDEQRSELDLRRARDARRKLRADITSRLQSRLSKPGSSLGTRVYRFMVIAFAFVAGSIAAFSAMAAVPDMMNNAGTTSMVSTGLAYARFFGSSALAAVFAFYLLGYIKKLEAEDRRFERELEKLSLDIDRASWVIETVMEFRDEEDGMAVPDAWLQGATANLFGADDPKAQTDENALDALAELLRGGAKLKIGNGGAELEIDSKAAKKIARDE